MTTAFADMHLQTKEPAYAECVFEMADWLGKLQHDAQEPQRAMWRGGFAAVADGKVLSTPPTVDTAYGAMAFADACRMIRQMDRPDPARYDRYRTSLTRALQFLATLQYGDENTAAIVKAYFNYIISAEGQQVAQEAAGSAPLSDSIRQTIQPAVDAIGGS